MKLQNMIITGIALVAIMALCCGTINAQGYYEDQGVEYKDTINDNVESIAPISTITPIDIIIESWDYVDIEIESQNNELEEPTGFYYPTKYGNAYLKAGGLEFGKYMVFEDMQNMPHYEDITRDAFGQQYLLKFYEGSDSILRIISVEPYKEQTNTTIENQTTIVNDTNITNQTIMNDTIEPMTNITMNDTNMNTPIMNDISLSDYVTGNPYILLIVAIMVVLVGVAISRKY